jgi:hypothetical protein
MLVTQMRRSLMKNLVVCLMFIIQKTNQLGPQILTSFVVPVSQLMCLVLPVVLVPLLMPAAIVLVFIPMVLMVTICPALLPLGLVTTLIPLMVLVAAPLISPTLVGLVTALIPLLTSLMSLVVLVGAHLISPTLKLPVGLATALILLPSRVPGGSRGRSSHIANPEAGSDSDHEDNMSDNGKTANRATRNSKSHGDAKPSQLGYYRGAWLDVLIAARNNYRKMIHTSNPFPERNPDNLREAHNFLLEAIAEHTDQGGQLDECSFILSFSFLKHANNMIAVYNANSFGMTAYVSI